MTTTTTNQTRMEADPDLPAVRIVPDFDAPLSRVSSRSVVDTMQAATRC